MTKKFVLAGFATVALSAMLCGAQAANGDLSQLISACESNMLCSNEATRDGTVFKLRLPQRTNTMLCDDDGVCEVLLARGQKFKVEDALLRLKAK